MVRRTIPEHHQPGAEYSDYDLVQVQDRIKDAFDDLHATNIEDLDTRTTENTSDISNLRALSGTSDGATNLGTFTGDVIAANETIKGALQDLADLLDSIDDGIAGGALVTGQGFTYDTTTNVTHGLSKTATGAFVAYRNNVRRSTFHANPNGTSTTINNSTWTTIDWGSANWNVGGDFSTSTDDYTTPHQGYFGFAGTLTIQSLADQKQFLCRLSGSVTRHGNRAYASGTASVGSTYNCVFLSNASVSWKMQGWHNHGSSRTTASNAADCWWEGGSIIEEEVTALGATTASFYPTYTDSDVDVWVW